MNHTPTPWSATDNLIFNRHSETIGQTSYVDYISDEESKANAKFIVKAVNNHDLLVNTLKEINKVLSYNDTYSDEEGEGFNNSEIMRLESIIIDVLNKIEKS